MLKPNRFNSLSQSKFSTGGSRVVKFYYIKFLLLRHIHFESKIKSLLTADKTKMRKPLFFVPINFNI